MDVEILSRIQFAFTLTFHYIYPPLSIGISIALIIMEAMYLKTKDPVWEKITKFWVKVFAMTFALGVATGIPLQFSLGTNWSRFSRFCGDAFGSLLGAEGFFAFMIEAGFLGVLLFGWNKVSHKVHFIATIMVSAGAHFSAIWIVSANSWMHTPAGYQLAIDTDGFQVAQVTDWWAMFLNPINMSSIIHVLLSAWMTGTFLILSVAAYYLLKKQYREFSLKTMKLATIMAVTTTLLQLWSADDLAGDVAKYNPEKFAALEGVFETKEHTPAYLFGWVDREKKTVYGLGVPGLLSFLSYRDFTTPVNGLEQFPVEEWPNIQVVFQVYHLMIIMWVCMFVACMIPLYYWWKKRLNSMNPRLLKYLCLAAIFPQIANIAGWFTSCMGRQPWSVYKLLKTKDAFSARISAGQVWMSLILFVILYIGLFILFLYLLDRKIKHGPSDEEEQIPYRDELKKE